MLPVVLREPDQLDSRLEFTIVIPFSEKEPCGIDTMMSQAMYLSNDFLVYAAALATTADVDIE